jgi:Tol biopolymer transport system component
MRKLIVLLPVMLAVLGALFVVPAEATPRGVNGRITYDVNGNGIVTANPDGSSVRPLISNGCCADFSPDGSKLAIPYLTADGRIGPATINADGTGYTPFPIDDPTLNVGCGTGSWSPDGKRLACESWNDSNPAQNGIYTISSADGSGLTRLTSNPLGGHDIPGSYAPDGKRIVFIRFDANMNSAGMFVLKSTGQLRQILPAGMILNIGADWAPQGNEIIFSRHVTPDVLGSIWVVHSDRTGLHEIHIEGLDCGASYSDPNGVGCHGVRWSPDGKKIIFVAISPATGVRNIYTANADGSGLAQVSFDGSDDDPAWGTHPLVQ